MKTMTLLILLVLGVVAHAQPLVVEIKPATRSWHVNVPVDVVLKVTNASKDRQTIKVWLCSWERNWSSSDAALAWSPWDCDKNYEKTEVLDPGGSKQWTLPMFPTRTAKPGEHALRMGFTSSGGTTVWSNPVVVTVGT
ncbi:MAG: hypothetical protein NT062_32570 [Proteobacteria bacterium]|nr:hypothetical protein [Pseudomonadota bacterium]